MPNGKWGNIIEVGRAVAANTRRLLALVVIGAVMVSGVLIVMAGLFILIWLVVHDGKEIDPQALVLQVFTLIFGMGGGVLTGYGLARMREELEGRNARGR